MTLREMSDPQNESLKIIEKFQDVPFSIKESHRKGDGGVLLIIGGCELYTGAPYYASKAAAMSGIDLIYILTCENIPLAPSTTSLKTLLPECIIIPILTFDIQKHSFILNRITSLVFGSGMGRPDTKIIDKIKQVFYFLSTLKKAPTTVVDGDGIYCMFTHKDIQIKNIILTPNFNEKKYISQSDHQILCILYKGSRDILMTDEECWGIRNEGSHRRCGGIGDVLAGLIASFDNHYDDPVQAVISASSLTRELSRRAWQKFKIAMSVKDILNEMKYYFASKEMIRRR